MSRKKTRSNSKWVSKAILGAVRDVVVRFLLGAIFTLHCDSRHDFPTNPSTCSVDSVATACLDTCATQRLSLCGVVQSRGAPLL